MIPCARAALRSASSLTEVTHAVAFNSSAVSQSGDMMESLLVPAMKRIADAV